MNELKRKNAIERYWLNKLSGELPKISLPMFDEVDANKEIKKTMLKSHLPKTTSIRLQKISGGSDVGLFILFLSGLYIALYKYTAVEDLVIGTISPGKVKVKDKILFCRIHISENLMFKELINQTKQIVLEAFNYSDYSFGSIYQKLLTRSETKDPDIFNIAFIYDKIQNKSKFLNQFNLVFVLSNQEDELNLQVEYYSNLYPKEIIQLFCQNLINIFNHLGETLDNEVSKMDILCFGETQRLFAFNKTEAQYPKGKTIHRLFTKQVEKTPDGIAIMFEDKQLTYRELHEQSNQFSRVLREKGVKAGTIVGVMIESSIEMIVGLLSILKSGGAYLPIDPQAPWRRSAEMLDDCDAAMLITTNSIVQRYSHSYTSLQGLKNSKVTPIYTSPRKQIRDLAALPWPDRSLVDYETYNQYIGQAMVKNIISLQTARGCPFDCAYCSKIWPRNHVFRPAESIFKELQLYYHMGIRRFSIFDDIFNVNMENGKKFFKLVIDNGLKVQLFFPNGLRGDLLTREYIDLAVEAGLTSTALALETASPRLQKMIRKNLNLEKFHENIHYFCEKHPQVILELFTIHGFPTETEEEAMVTMDFIKSLRWVHFPYVFILKIYPDTHMADIAIEKGIERQDILKCDELAFHELSPTSPFSSRFTRKYQADFLHEYFLAKERLLHVLPYQARVLTRDEIVQKYNSYLPSDIKSFEDILSLAEISEEELPFSTNELLDDAVYHVPGLNDTIRKYSPVKKSSSHALKVLFLDLTQYFKGKDMLYDVVEPPLGAMYIMTYLNEQLGDRIHGKIAKSRVDFDSYAALKTLLEEFQPDVIAARSLTFYRDFFHSVIGHIRQWGIHVPIIAGGPYATRNSYTLLQDTNIDLLVISEGESTFCEIIEKIIENSGKLPDEKVLRKIDGIAFVSKTGTPREKFAREIIMMDELIGTLPMGLAGNSRYINLPSDPAYVIFTSGSTGKPKGVIIDHQNAVNVLSWFGRNYNISSNTHVLQLTNYTFDPSVEQIFGTLLHGGVLYCRTKDLATDPGTFRTFVEKNQVHIINFVPCALNELLAGEKRLDSLKAVISGGEKLEDSLKNQLINKGYPLYNQYGPTETTIDALFTPCSPGKVTLGSPISNVQCYIFLKDNILAPIGVVGELAVAGDGVARGYLNNPTLTKEKFPPNPWKRGKRMYRTGDRARWLVHGNIEFLGRMDHQVKIRGLRIELGEIESRLKNHKNVKAAVVVMRTLNISDTEENENQSLCAYIVSDSQFSSSADELREFLLKELPGYMVPSYFVQIDGIPITPNGKIFHQALPSPQIRPEGEYTAPGDETEEKLVEIWSEVIGIEKSTISTDANFFETGGHSLKAITLASRIHKELNVNVMLAEIFKTPTVRGLAEFIKGEKQDSYVSIEPVEEKEYYVLSSAQKRLYILQQMVPESTAYNMPQAIHLEKPIEPEKLEEILNRLPDRHESLRTSFHMIRDEPVQKIHKQVEFKIEYYDLQVTGASDRLQVKEPFGQINAFDLSQAPLLRVGLIKTDETKRLLIVDMHHIISDGASHNILEREFNALLSYPEEESAPLRLQYKDFSNWQKSKAQEELIKQQKAYWLKEFSSNDELPVLNLPTDYQRPLMQSFEGSSINFLLTEKETQTLNDTAKETNATLYMSILSVYTVLLSKLSGQEDIIVGTPVIARRHADLEHIIGMFANTLAMRNYPSGKKTFKEFLIEVKEKTIEAFENQEYPFEDLVENISVRRDTSRNPIFDVMFNMINQSEYTGDPSKMIEQNSYSYENEHQYQYEYIKNTSKFDLNLTAIDLGTRILFTFEYCTRLFKASTIKRIIGYFKKILSLLSTNTTLKLWEMEIITGDEKDMLLKFGSGVEETSDPDQTIHGLFQEQAAKIPDHIAVLGIGHGAWGKAFTYRELNRKSHQLAQLLRQKGVKPDTVVGLMVERSVEMIVGILAIMKAGGAYLPIDIEYPEERKKYMLEDSGVKLLLTNCNREQVPGFIPGNVEVLDLEDNNIYRGDVMNPQPINRGSDFVYVIYTSGSTGKPKGVILEHRNLVNLFRFQYRYTNIDCSRILQFATISFDASFHEIFSALLSGGTLYLPDKEIRGNIPQLFMFIRRNAIKTLFLPMSFLKLIFRENDYIRLIPGCIRHIQTAGEQVVVSDRFRKYLRESNVYLHNHYGPSETHVVTTLTLEPGGDIPELPSIGKPILNTGIYIMNKSKHLLPKGVPGELYIGGIQVGRGYLNRPELTSESFLSISHKSYMSYIYRSGDLARWMSDGNVEFLGRIDHQLKIRGFRVELGEIESRLLNHPGIKEAVAAAGEEETGDKYLCAYIVSSGELEISGLREYLSKVLPDYMIPSYFVFLEKIPLTPNGKIDRKALPSPEVKADNQYIAPRNTIEKKLAELWAEVLNVQTDVIGIDRNFFELGGHSLKATVMTAKIHKQFQVRLPLAEIFKNPTISGLAQYIGTAAQDRYAYLEVAREKEYYPLSSAQKRLYVIQQMAPESTSYNIQLLKIVKGELPGRKLETIFRKLIERHETLRTSFEMIEEKPVQRIHDYCDVVFEIEYYDLAKEEKNYKLHNKMPLSMNMKKSGPAAIPNSKSQIPNKETGSHHSSFIIHHLFIRPFDLSRAPLMRVGLIKTNENEHILMMDMHHIVMDGISQGILEEELIALYHDRKLPPLTLQYKDYSEWQNCDEQKQVMGQQEMYWLKSYQKEIPVLDLPIDYERPSMQGFEGSNIDFVITTEQAAKLKTLALEQDATLYMVLLALYYVLLAKISGQEDIVVGTPVSGRNHSDLEPIIGMFVNTLALRNYPSAEKTFTRFLAEVKQRTIQAFDNQDYPFEELVEKLETRRDTGRNPIFDVMFAFQTQQEQSLNLYESMEVKIEPYEYENRTSKFDMVLSAVEEEHDLHCNIEYSTKLFKTETIERFAAYFEDILRDVLQNRNVKLKDIEISLDLVDSKSAISHEAQGAFGF